MQGSAWPLGFLMRHWSMLRNRMLADPAFPFKIVTEEEAFVDGSTMLFVTFPAVFLKLKDHNVGSQSSNELHHIFTRVY